MARPIKHQLAKSPMILGKKVEEYKLPLEELSHIVGQAAAIRFFDENSRDDFEAVNEILQAKQIRNWMDDAGKISWKDYRIWAGTHTKQSFLFSVHDSRLEKKSQIKVVRGFVNIYSERGEKYRVKRMVKEGIIKESGNKHFLEISMAIRPFEDGSISGSGLMSSALRQSCLQVRSWLNYPKESELVIYGFIDPKNVASIRAIKAAGFIEKGKSLYDSTADDKSLVYILSWRKLKKIVNDKMETALRNKMKVIMEPQKTDSHCGPAVVKTLLGFHKIEVNQDDVVNSGRVRTTIMKKGMRPTQIALAVKSLGQGLNFWYKQNATSRDLEKLIHIYKIPVAVNWQGLFFDSVKEEKVKNIIEDRGHYSIVIDINIQKDEIMIDDPFAEYFAIPRIFSYKWFRSRWWDKDEVIKRSTNERNVLKTKKLIFVITPKNVKFPQSLGMKGMSQLVELERVG